ncbi:MAG: biotin--[acetyl-CoA-carboxylase] ligase [bacterium]
MLIEQCPGYWEYSLNEFKEWLGRRSPGAEAFKPAFAAVSEAQYYFPLVTSTNDLLKSRLRASERGTMLVVCDGQTAGRGTGRRTWTDRFGKDLLFSLAMDVSDFKPRGLLSLAAGAAIARNIEALINVPVGVKWPNDIVIAKRKAGGILVELLFDSFAVVGVGINCRSRRADFPEKLAPAVTSIMEELPGGVEPEHLTFRGQLSRLPFLIAAAGGIVEAISAGSSGSLAGLLAEFEKRDQTRGATRMVLVDGGYVSAECREVDYETGELVVRLSDGSLRRVASAQDVLDPETNV